MSALQSRTITEKAVMIAGVQHLRPGVHRWQIKCTPQTENAPHLQSGVQPKRVVSLLGFFATKVRNRWYKWLRTFILFYWKSLDNQQVLATVGSNRTPCCQNLFVFRGNHIFLWFSNEPPFQGLDYVGFACILAMVFLISLPELGVKPVSYTHLTLPTKA